MEESPDVAQSSGCEAVAAIRARPFHRDAGEIDADIPGNGSNIGGAAEDVEQPKRRGVTILNCAARRQETVSTLTCAMCVSKIVVFKVMDDTKLISVVKSQWRSWHRFTSLLWMLVCLQHSLGDTMTMKTHPMT